jgi:hypothetical protein
MSALRQVKKVKGGYEVTVKCTGTPMQTRVFGSYQECEVFADDYFFDYLGVQLKCAHHPVGDGIEPEGLNPDSLETVEIEIPMNERLKELIEKAGLSALLGNNWLYGEELEEFAELVLQNYASQIMTTEERERFIRDDEREACAKLCEDLQLTDLAIRDWADGTYDCAKAIRARGNHEQTR